LLTKVNEFPYLRLTMRILAAALSLAVFSLASTADAHGGGCRKSSPPGKCCHMDNSAGSVHCH